MSSALEAGTRVSVVAAIVVNEPTDLPDTLAAVRRQVYEPAKACIVGGGAAARRLAEAEEVEWLPNLGNLIEGTDADTSYLWILHEGTVPRPDALHALVRDAERVGAGIAGSKVLRRDDPSALLSVGFATDVFDVAYTGLDSSERDQGQYDVVRDVAAVSGSSMLIRRDLARGLGGPDRLMSPQPAAIDLCQRARLRGSRVVVVPSSEVLAPEASLRSDGWRDDAGRIRAMMKAYGPLTLLWVIPLDIIVALVAAVMAPFAGRWTLFASLRAGLWNLASLPSTFRARRQARHGRAVGDQELFRYQRRGSATLQELGSEIATRVRHRLPGEDRFSFEALGRDLRQPAIVTGVIAVFFVLLATRSIWPSGLPAVGSSLPFPTGGLDAIREYAGGWNPAGLGSIEAVRPLIGIVGVLETVLLDNRRLAEYAMTTGAFVLGIWGTTRLLRTWGIGPVAGILGGVTLVAGSAAQGIATATQIGTLVGLGILPWALRVPLARWPRTMWGRIGRVAGAGWLIALMAALAPALLILPLTALLVWAIVNVRDGGAWRAAGIAALGTAVATPLLLPWLGAADLEAFLETGTAFWDPPLVFAVAAGLAALAAVVVAPTRLALVAGWGAILAAGGTLLARSADLGWGTEVENVGLAAAALGLAAIVGASLETITRRADVVGWRRLVGGLGAAAAILVTVSAVAVLVPGRAGLPGDEFHDVLDFTLSRPGDAAASRVLMLGPPDDLPGESRQIQGAGYRVVSAPMPSLDEVWLGAPLAGDDALRAALDRVIATDTVRAGEELAPFGIRWIVIMGESEVGGDPETRAWIDVLSTQLDLIPLGGGLRQPTYANEAEPAARAIADDGNLWIHATAGYAGPSDPGRLVVAENANSRWGPGDWAQIEWANSVSAETGEASFREIQNRRLQAILAAIGFAVLVGLSWWGRRSS